MVTLLLLRRPLVLLLLLACSSSTPKPFVRREGQTEVIGDGDLGSRNADRPADQGAPNSPAPSGRRDEGGGMLPANVTRVAPAVDGDLPPVADDYEDLVTSRVITACPTGTVLVDERAEQGRMYCTLPNHVRHGPYIDFHNSGHAKDVGPYVGGLRHGWWSEWDRTGTLKGRWRWVSGSPVEGKVPE